MWSISIWRERLSSIILVSQLSSSLQRCHFYTSFSELYFKDLLLVGKREKGFYSTIGCPSMPYPFSHLSVFLSPSIPSNFPTRPCQKVIDCQSLPVISGVTGNLEYARWGPGLPNEALQHIYACRHKYIYHWFNKPNAPSLNPVNEALPKKNKKTILISIPLRIHI